MTQRFTTGLVIALLAVIAALTVSLGFQHQRLSAVRLERDAAQTALEGFQRAQVRDGTQAKARAKINATASQKAQEVQHAVSGRVIADDDTVSRLQELADTINSGLVP